MISGKIEEFSIINTWGGGRKEDSSRQSVKLKFDLDKIDFDGKTKKLIWILMGLFINYVKKIKELKRFFI